MYKIPIINDVQKFKKCDGVLLKTPHPEGARGWKATARACGQKVA